MTVMAVAINPGTVFCNSSRSPCTRRGVVAAAHMPELLSPSHIGSAGAQRKKKKKQEEKEVLVYSSEDGIEKRGWPSQYAEFFLGSSVGEYLYKRIKEKEVSEHLHQNGLQLEEEDPESYQKLLELRDSLLTQPLPHFKRRYHHKLVEEASKTVRLERPAEEHNDEYFVLSDEDRARLETMFAEMNAEHGKGGEEGEHALDSEDSAEGNEGNGEDEAELEREEEEEASDNEGEEDDYEEGYSNFGLLEMEPGNGKPKKGGHFSRWENDPKMRAKKSDKKEKKFKPRLNTVWQRRLEDSKERGRKVELAAMLPMANGTLFNSIMPKKFRRKSKSRYPVVNNSSRHEPSNVELDHPRQNRSSELRLQKRLLQEAMTRGANKSCAGKLSDGQQRRLRRSQSHGAVSRDITGAMRRTTSMHTLPSHERGVRGRKDDRDKAEDTSGGRHRKSTPHPGRRTSIALTDSEEFGDCNQEDEHEDAEENGDDDDIENEDNDDAKKSSEDCEKNKNETDECDGEPETSHMENEDENEDGDEKLPDSGHVSVISAFNDPEDEDLCVPPVSV